ncbi:hypothetical protein N5C54_24295 [Pseudomonas chengduensis]|uniref:hypothetical protein n=1 Tax=Pseudomonas sp. o96-267 TaxID=2479853 RepID=UPI000F790EF6|nr:MULTISPECIES: hypothetical protein [Pseudomonas]MDH0960904.1 hypothetical protein [Pseudomonas chengduensis]MDV5863678.1 hypothetical protein [Pseudomonas mendocina]
MEIARPTQPYTESLTTLLVACALIVLCIAGEAISYNLLPGTFPSTPSKSSTVSVEKSVGK